MKFPLAIVVAILILTSSLHGGVEAVYVRKVLDSSNQVIIQRRNGEVWLLEYGVGVISIWQYEGKAILIPELDSAGIESRKAVMRSACAQRSIFKPAESDQFQIGTRNLWSCQRHSKPAIQGRSLGGSKPATILE